MLFKLTVLIFLLLIGVVALLALPARQLTTTTQVNEESREVEEENASLNAETESDYLDDEGENESSTHQYQTKLATIVSDDSDETYC